MGKENKKAENANVKQEAVHIAPPNMQIGEIWIKGISPLVIQAGGRQHGREGKEERGKGFHRMLQRRTPPFP